MHADYISKLPIHSVEDWKRLIYEKGMEHNKMEVQAGMFAKNVLLPTSQIEQIFAGEKQKLLDAVRNDSIPSDLELAPYAAKEVGRQCLV